MSPSSVTAGDDGTQPVTVTLEQLYKDVVPFQTLEDAFGPAALGIIVVTGLPAEYEQLRSSVLSCASYLANLPEQALSKLESPESKWLVGWSCGREKLRGDGRFDVHKGSFYVNCAASFQQPGVRERLARDYPASAGYTAPNLWPDDALLPGFQDGLERLCRLIVDVAALVARACDRYAVARIKGYRPGTLETVVRTSASTKARLLHYFPRTAPSTAAGREAERHEEPTDNNDNNNKNDNNNDNNDDDWCATHVDHGCLTGLTSAMFIDETGLATGRTGRGPSQPLPELPAAPDPRAGLYVRARTGRVVKMRLPADCLAFQTGAALEAMTRGSFRAVPHFVRCPAPHAQPTSGPTPAATIARNTLAVFTQPDLATEVEPGKDFATFAAEIVDRNH